MFGLGARVILPTYTTRAAAAHGLPRVARPGTVVASTRRGGGIEARGAALPARTAPPRRLRQRGGLRARRPGWRSPPPPPTPAPPGPCCAPQPCAWRRGRARRAAARRRRRGGCLPRSRRCCGARSRWRSPRWRSGAPRGKGSDRIPRHVLYGGDGCVCVCVAHACVRARSVCEALQATRVPTCKRTCATPRRARCAASSARVAMWQRARPEATKQPPCCVHRPPQGRACCLVV